MGHSKSLTWIPFIKENVAELCKEVLTKNFPKTDKRAGFTMKKLYKHQIKNNFFTAGTFLFNCWKI